MDRITKAQLAKIWACAKALGIDKDTLHLLTPRGSISALSFQEASELIEHLVRLGADQRPPAAQKIPQSALEADKPNQATRDQHNLIHFLFRRLGWVNQPERIHGFLRKYAGVDQVQDIRDRRRASAIIEALKAMHSRQKNQVR